MIGDANGERRTNLGDDFIEGFNDRAPNLFSVMFNPARFGEVLREFAIRRDDFLAINKNGTAPNASSSSVNSHDVSRVGHCYLFLRLFERNCEGPVVVRLVGAGRFRVGCEVDALLLLDDWRLDRGVRAGVSRRRSLSVLRW